MSEEETMDQSKTPRRNNFLPKDVMKMILSKLPAESLMRFKCVSKEWYSLITADSHFNSCHLQNQCHSNFSQLCLLFVRRKCPENRSTCKICLLRDEPKVENLDTSYIINSIDCHNEKSYYVDDMTVCCNGLVCLTMDSKEENSSKIILWNPATREFRNLPEPSVNDKFVSFYKINLGFDPSNKDYRLLRMAHDYKGDNDFEVHLFSLKRNCWREIKTCPSFITSYDLRRSRVELNGVLYWLPRTHEKRHGVLSFDLSVEEFREMDTPSTGRSKTEVRGLVKWRGKSLGAIVQSYYTDVLEFWSMENDVSFGLKRRWSKQWTVSAPALNVDRWEWLGVWKDRFLVVKVVLGGDVYEETLVSYDFSSGKERLLAGKDAMSRWSIEHYKAFDFLESLVSVDPER